MTGTIGAVALRRLRASGTALGLVLDVPLRATVEFLAPPGCSASWPPLTGTRCVASGSMRWPSPLANLRAGRRAACGRRWIVAPATAGPLTTDGDELCEAVAPAPARHPPSLAAARRSPRAPHPPAALAHLAGVWLSDVHTKGAGRGPVRRVS
ncbi:hypothetical protein ACFWMG_39125 [Streptomyces sp. NPDC127074]|uniref:hypothetical protein n=1 Tax=Streptomyces sp. NPDC127074 TaxID=3347130 RepID=UPI0036676DE3